MKHSAELKRSETWWFEFTYDGRRIRESAKTSKKSIAVEAEKGRRLELEKARADRIQSVSAALKSYQKTYRIGHRDKSVSLVLERSAHLQRLLGKRLFSDLTEDRILDYITARQEQGASGRTINMELSILSRAMGNLWRVLWPTVPHLEENRDVGRALEPAEEDAVMAAASRNRSKLIYLFLMTLAWTGLRSDEGRLLRWSQVDFAAGQVVVGKSKSPTGKGRIIPMSKPLRYALEHHAEYMRSRFGPLQPEWFWFCRSSRTRPTDPTEPVTTMKSAWESVRKKAGVKCRLHDLRHSFASITGEAGVPESTMLDMMGHLSEAMLRRYCHSRVQARRDAIDAVEARHDVLHHAGQDASQNGLPQVPPIVHRSKVVN